ncbi:MAG: nitrophenyl compound nitroreductase subunit ArsF family protein [Victivallales bacterium]|nr:nitrophenyl compound nitroreductase subunit ArsF family protein [Victivallales bacterium]
MKSNKYSKLISLTKFLLIGFVLVSIGFFAGKESAGVKNGVSETAVRKPEIPVLVRVYYMHGNKRCRGCIKLEEMTQELLHRDYEQALAAGNIEFRRVNFQQDKQLAELFNVISSCIVIARIEDGKVGKYEIIGRIWDLAELSKQLHTAISNCSTVDKVLK